MTEWKTFLTQFRQDVGTGEGQGELAGILSGIRQVSFLLTIFTCSSIQKLKGDVCNGHFLLA